MGLASEGASVVVADIEDTTESVRLVREGGGRAIGVTVDVSDEEQVGAMTEAAIAEFGGIDILINNAARHLGRTHEGITLPPAEWRKILDVNVVGPVICAQQCRPSMASRGGGVIVNQSSDAAYVPPGGAYGVSKLALNRLTTGLALELAADRIRVVGIAPGMITSEAVLASLSIEEQERIIDLQMIHRPGAIADCVNTVLFLCSDEASFITGQTVTVDGGYAART
jgi:NAD(P)-dependent dehydrogenase (short-subunit alcohol dehydrogenase family)